MSQRIIKLRQVWEERGARRIRYSIRPKVDFNPDGTLNVEQAHQNIKLRLKHLSKVVHLLYTIYLENKDLYGDMFLAFVGNEVFRKWPWKDFPYTSVEAQKIIGESITGLTEFEIKNKELEKFLIENIRYEHWTPISFFRDLFDMATDLTEDDFYYALVMYYRVVRITHAEDALLNKKNKTTRSVNTYADFNIEILEKDLWLKSFEK
jgi:hypothetical protein